MKRSIRIAALTAMFTGVGVLFQVGGCVATALTIGSSSIDFCSLLGGNCTLGPIAFCGNPNTAFDDILVDCPLPVPP